MKRKLEHSIQELEEENKSFVFSDEVLTSTTRPVDFYERLSTFDRIGYQGEYLLFIRDIKDLVISMGPSVLIMLRASGKLDFSLNEHGKLDHKKALNILSKWFDNNLYFQKNDKPSLSNTLLNYEKMILTLGPERTHVIKYMRKLESNASFRGIISDRFHVQVPDSLTSGRSNSENDSWSRILDSRSDIEMTKIQYKEIVLDYYDRCIYLDESIKRSEEILCRTDPDKHQFSEDLL